MFGGQRARSHVSCVEKASAESFVRECGQAASAQQQAAAAESAFRAAEAAASRRASALPQGAHSPGAAQRLADGKVRHNLKPLAQSSSWEVDKGPELKHDMS